MKLVITYNLSFLLLLSSLWAHMWFAFPISSTLSLLSFIRIRNQVWRPSKTGTVQSFLYRYRLHKSAYFMYHQFELYHLAFYSRTVLWVSYDCKNKHWTFLPYATLNFDLCDWDVMWIGHILRRNCLLQRVIEGKIKGGIEVTGRRGIRRRKLLDDLKERKGYSHLKEEALDRTIWRARFGRGFGPVVRQTTKWMNECPCQ